MCAVELFNRLRRSLLSLVVIAVLSQTTNAQQVAPGIPTTIQLPTFSSFSVNTSVSVPDSGGAYTEEARLARMRGSNGLQPAGATANRQRRAGQGGAPGWRGSATGRVDSTASADALYQRANPQPAPAAAPAGIDAFAQALAAARHSSAGRPAPSVARARAMWLAEQTTKIAAGKSRPRTERVSTSSH